MIKTTLRLACIATLALACAPAFGQDTLKVAVAFAETPYCLMKAVTTPCVEEPLVE